MITATPLRIRSSFWRPPAATMGTVTTVANTSGGLPKLGAGTLALTGGYTYTNATVVLGGTLSLNSSTIAPATAGNLIVSNAALTLDASSGATMPANNVMFRTNATLNLTANPGTFGLSGLGNLSLETNVTMNFNYGTLSGNPSVAVINASGSISAPGTNILLSVSG